MIANLVNTALGIALVYVAVLRPVMLLDNRALLAAAIAIFALALWARRTDPARWYSNTDVSLALALLLLASAQWSGNAATLLMFWGVFWVGIVVAVVSLWAALYRPKDPEIT
jgi:hypothetical protein